MNYLALLNSGAGVVQFQAIYYKGRTLKTKMSGKLSPGSMDKIEIPSDTSVTGIRVGIVGRFGSFKEFFHDSAPGSQQRCYEVTGTASKPSCSTARCSDIAVKDYIYVLNKTSEYMKVESVYYISSEHIINESTEIKPGRGFTEVIPHSAKNGILKISLLEDGTKKTWHTIYSAKFPVRPVKLCYRVDGNLTKPLVTKISCPSIQENGATDRELLNSSLDICNCCCMCNCNCSNNINNR